MYELLHTINDWLKVLLIIPVIAGAIYYKKLTQPLKILYAFVLFDLAITILTGILNNRNINNLFFINLFNVVEMYVITFVFGQLLRAKRIVWLIKLAYIVYALTILITFIFYKALNEYANHLKLVESFFFIIFATYYLYGQIKSEINLARNPYVWFVVGVLLYYTSSFLIYGSFHYLVEFDKLMGFKIWVMKNVLMHAFFILIAVAFYKQKQIIQSR